MRVLITGTSGFAGGYLAEACAAADDEVLGLSRSGGIPPGAGEGIAADLRDGAAVRRVLRDLQPEVIYHLAALSSVGRSWEDPARTLEENVGGAATLLDAVRHEAPAAHLLWASSCEVYGTSGQLPIVEDAPLRPENPYAVSKSAGEQLASLYARAHGLALTRVRPFNHNGPRQRPIFISSSLARQAAQARLDGVGEMTIATGNADTRRDFTDVRDVVRAYRKLVERARGGGGNGEVYNVCTGNSISAGEQVAVIAELIAPIEVHHEVDPARVRKHEVMDLRGDHSRLSQATGWQPEIPFRQSMQDAIEWWERELARDGARAAGG